MYIALYFCPLYVIVTTTRWLLTESQAEMLSPYLRQHSKGSIKSCVWRSWPYDCRQNICIIDINHRFQFPHNIFAGEHMWLRNLREEVSERGLDRKGGEWSMPIFYAKQAVDLSGKKFNQERMVLLPCTAMNSTMRYFQFRCKNLFLFLI